MNAVTSQAQAEVGFGQLQLQLKQVLAARQMQRAGFRQQTLALLQQVGDVLATGRLELQRVRDGAGGLSVL